MIHSNYDRAFLGRSEIFLEHKRPIYCTLYGVLTVEVREKYHTIDVSNLTFDDGLHDILEWNIYKMIRLFTFIMCF